MRSLLNHTVRPRIGHAGVNNPKLIAQSPRKSISASGGRKLSFNDAFTILLAPVLGTALLIDTTWKDKKKEDWSKKLALVQSEIDALRERELQVWTNLQLRSARHGALQQHRSYSTTARAYANEADCGLEIPEEETDAGSSLFTPLSETSSIELADWKRYENLVASKLAIEMILHIRSGKSVLHRLPTEVVLDKANYPESLDDLVGQLVQINANLKTFASSTALESVPRSAIETEERNQLHQHIISLCRSCRRGQIPVRDLVHGYAQAVAKAEVAPSIATYNALLEALSAQDNDSLAYTVMGAMRNSKQYLSSRSIWAMLWQYGKYKDAGRLDEFLWLLTKENSILRLRSRWQHVFVNDVRVPVPHDHNPHLLSVLVRVALQCGLLHRAEAWATLLFQQGKKCQKYAYIFANMIQHCAENGNWRAGHEWIEKAVMWASVVSEEAPEALSRIIFRMLDLCVTCDQSADYDKILQATVKSGVQPNMIDREKPLHFSDRALSIRDDWERQFEEHYKIEGSSLRVKLSERAWHFQSILANEDADLKPFVGVTDVEEVVRLAASKEPTVSAADAIGTLVSPDEIILDAGRSPSSIQNRKIRSLRRSLKELLKQSEHQKTQIQGLVTKLSASEKEVALLKATSHNHQQERIVKRQQAGSTDAQSKLSRSSQPLMKDDDEKSRCSPPVTNTAIITTTSSVSTRFDANPQPKSKSKSTVNMTTSSASVVAAAALPPPKSSSNTQLTTYQSSRYNGNGNGTISVSYHTGPSINIHNNKNCNFMS